VRLTGEILDRDLSADTTEKAGWKRTDFSGARAA
jgi:hypothetical protein